MKSERTAGALQYPAYLLVWSIGVLLFTGSFYRADAALVSALPITFEPLASVPSLVSDGEFKLDLNTALSGSDVMAGTWQPGSGSPGEAVQQPSPGTLKPPSAVVDGPAPVRQVPAQRISGVVGESSAGRPSEVVREKSADPPVQSSMRKLAVSTSTVRVSDEVVALRREARKALGSGDSAGAFRMLMHNVRIAGNDEEYLALLAVAALEERLPREALLVYEKLIKLDRLDSRWWMGLAVCQERLGADATAIYEEVVRLTEEGSDLQRLALDRLDTIPGVT